MGTDHRRLHRLWRHHAQTDVGRIIATTLGVLGVVTIGVIAGLILDQISPRTID